VIYTVFVAGYFDREVVQLKELAKSRPRHSQRESGIYTLRCGGFEVEPDLEDSRRLLHFPRGLRGEKRRNGCPLEEISLDRDPDREILGEMRSASSFSLPSWFTST